MVLAGGKHNYFSNIYLIIKISRIKIAIDYENR